MAPSETAKKPAAGSKKVKKPNGHKNRELADGIMRFSRMKQFERTRKYLLKNVKKVRVEKPKVAITVVKKIGGAKNGGERVVQLKKSKSFLPTKAYVKKRPSKRCFKNHPRYIRKSLTAGKVLILLAGRHKGKRVVLMKVLKSGLLLVNGPFSVNGCPLRRISQRYVIATKTKLDMKNVEVPKHIDDKYFKRQAVKKNSRAEGDIFAKKEEKYVASEQRKADQKVVDAAVLKAIKSHKEGLVVKKYLKSMFALRSNQFPHRMRF